MTDRNAEQRDFWSTGPGRYWVSRQEDMDLLFRPMTEALDRVVGPRTGMEIVDIGCGAGGTSLHFADRVGASGRVTGLDISAPLVEKCRQRAREQGCGNVSFVLGDAQVHPFAEGSADTVVSRFGVMFFEDTGAAFANLARALKPGGRMVFATWAAGPKNPWFTMPRDAMIDFFGDMPAVDPDAPGPMALRDVDRVCGLLAGAGLANVSGQEMSVPIHHPGGLEAALDVQREIGPIQRAMADRGASVADRETIIDGLRGRFAGFAHDGGIDIPAAINIFSAHRP